MFINVDRSVDDFDIVIWVDLACHLVYRKKFIPLICIGHTFHVGAEIGRHVLVGLRSYILERSIIQRSNEVVRYAVQLICNRGLPF